MDKEICKDTDGMLTYDYIVNNMPECIDRMDYLTDCLVEKDTTGKYIASSIRFLAALDREAYAAWIGKLLQATIVKDRERRYLGSLLEAVWGTDYKENAETLKKNDDNFRRIYKRIFEK